MARTPALARKEPDALAIATHMREAVGYLAALASRTEFHDVARQLLGVHLALGLEIETRTEAKRGRYQACAPARARASGPIRH